MTTVRSFVEAAMRKPTLKTILFTCVLITVLHYVIKFEQIRDHGDYKNLVIPVDELDLSKYPPLGLSQFETFPLSGPLRVPRIIHQTWKNTEIPMKLTKWVKSWILKNPDYEYWLWTDESARALIADRHPYLLPTFDGYTEGIRKADALRYVVLYEFGGVYADMDMESLKPLDPILRKYACIIPQEPYEHPILYGNFENLSINAVMACRAKHPFMKMLMDNLEYFSHMWDVLDSTGPHFVLNNLKRYKASNTYINDTHKDGIYLAPAEYFFPTIDPTKHFWFRIQCSNFDKLTTIQKRACVSLKYRGEKKKPLSVSFATHHWIHTYIDFRLSLKGPVNIKEVIPKVKIYHGQTGINVTH